MREEIINVYQFDELSEEAKKVAIEGWRKSIEWDIDGANITEMFAEELKQKGLPTEDIAWSLSHCQGDGVAFYGTIDSDGMEILAKELLGEEKQGLLEAIYNEDCTLQAKISRNSYGYHYSHWNSMDVEMIHDDIDVIIECVYGHTTEDEYYDTSYMIVNDLINKLQYVISDYVKNVSRDLERQGYDEIEYIESDEHIIETIRANSYEYTADGKMY